MKTICKSCCMAFPTNEDYVGCLVTCPHCGDKRVLKEEDLIKTATRKPAARRPVQVQEESGIDPLCFILGLFFSVFGVIIAAVIGNRRGVVSSLWGIATEAILGVIGWIFIAVAAGLNPS